MSYSLDTNIDRTTCKHGHPWTKENLRRHNGHDECKTCCNARTRAYKAAKRKERPPKEPRTTCKHGHPWTKENLRRHNGRDECLTCHRGGPIKTKRGPKEYCPHGHQLIEGNLKKSGKKKGRQCLTCHKLKGRERYHNNPQLMVAQATAYAKSHRAQINVRFREYRKLESWKERSRATSFRTHARKGRRTGVSDRELYTDQESRFYLSMIQQDPCSYCGKPMEAIDHIVPLSKGGSEEWTNLTSACKRCNSRKHDKSLLQFFLYRVEHGF